MIFGWLYIAQASLCLEIYIKLNNGGRGIMGLSYKGQSRFINTCSLQTNKIDKAQEFSTSKITSCWQRVSAACAAELCWLPQSLNHSVYNHAEHDGAVPTLAVKPSSALVQQLPLLTLLVSNRQFYQCNKLYKVNQGVQRVICRERAKALCRAVRVHLSLWKMIFGNARWLVHFKGSLLFLWTTLWVRNHNYKMRLT